MYISNGLESSLCLDHKARHILVPVKMTQLKTCTINKILIDFSVLTLSPKEFIEFPQFFCSTRVSDDLIQIT